MLKEIKGSLEDVTEVLREAADMLLVKRIPDSTVWLATAARVASIALVHVGFVLVDVGKSVERACSTICEFRFAEASRRAAEQTAGAPVAPAMH